MTTDAEYAAARELADTAMAELGLWMGALRGNHADLATVLGHVHPADRHNLALRVFREQVTRSATVWPQVTRIHKGSRRLPDAAGAEARLDLVIDGDRTAHMRLQWGDPFSERPMQWAFVEAAVWFDGGWAFAGHIDDPTAVLARGTGVMALEGEIDAALADIEECSDVSWVDDARRLRRIDPCHQIIPHLPDAWEVDEAEEES